MHFSVVLFQGELEKLNQSTGDINRCETALEVSPSREEILLTALLGSTSGDQAAPTAEP